MLDLSEAWRLAARYIEAHGEDAAHHAISDAEAARARGNELEWRALVGVAGHVLDLLKQPDRDAQRH